MKKQYVIATTLSQFRINYVVPIEEVYEEYPNISDEAIEQWIEDMILNDELKEFSQEWLGTTPVVQYEYDEEDMLKKFDSENEYLCSWSKEQKLSWIRDEY